MRFPRNPRRQAGFLALLTVTTVAGGCGGGAPTSPPPPPPPPPVDNVRNVAIAGGSGQTANSGQAVAVAPSVRVTNSTGAPVAGIPVTFAVGLGGGSVSGPSQTTGSDGTASVGGWTLGAPGDNTLVATVTGATNGSPATFTATAAEIVVAPSQDTAMAGVVAVTRFMVPAGVTITLTGDLTIQATARVDIAGTIAGDCHRVEINGTGEVVMAGTIDNTCSDPADPPAAVRIVARAGYELGDATLQSSGDVELTNDPSLTDQSFLVAVPGAVRAKGPAALTPPCRITRTRYLASPARAPDGAPGGPTGGAGAPARTFTARCNGDLDVPGGLLFKGQHGGNGGAATDQNSLEADAVAGAGGAGGLLRFQVVGNITFSGANRIESGKGGDGGQALGQGLFNTGTLTKAAGARAFGGTGGAPGVIEIRATGTLAFGGPTDLVLGNAGKGGDAYAVAANGTDASATGRASQGGGLARAEGGQGGHAPDLQATAAGPVTGAGNIHLTGGNGGDGGLGHAEAGNGGAGDPNFPNGADGGDATAFAGWGGNTDLKQLNGVRVGDGGAGAKAVIQFGNGGAGGDRCNALVLAGGNGGKGGRLEGHHSQGGTGLVAGADGIIELTNMGRGGRGGNGAPVGTGGTGGNQSMSKTPVIISFGGATNGRNGFNCLNALGGANGVYVPRTSGDPPSCRVLSTNVEFVSFTTETVEYTIAFDQANSSGPQVISFKASLDATPPSPGLVGTVGPYVEAVHDVVGARTSVLSYYDRCQTVGPFINVFKVTGRVGAGPPFAAGQVVYDFTP